MNWHGGLFFASSKFNFHLSILLLETKGLQLGGIPKLNHMAYGIEKLKIVMLNAQDRTSLRVSKSLHSIRIE